MRNWLDMEHCRASLRDEGESGFRKRRVRWRERKGSGSSVKAIPCQLRARRIWDDHCSSSFMGSLCLFVLDPNSWGFSLCQMTWPEAPYILEAIMHAPGRNRGPRSLNPCRLDPYEGTSNLLAMVCTMQLIDITLYRRDINGYRRNSRTRRELPIRGELP